jgi:hypothetical protein
MSWNAPDEISLACDIHVLRGHSSPNLLDRLRVVSPAGSLLASAYLALPSNDVTFTFRPLFIGTPNGPLYEGLGLHCDTTTGVVRVDANPPPLTVSNFIIEVTATNVGTTQTFQERMRVQVHGAVTRVWLTPGRLTVRPPPGGAGDTQMRFVVRAQFDDGVLGDLTAGHDVSWSPVAHVFGNGSLVVNAADARGSEFDVFATLPAAFGEQSPGVPWSTTGKLRVEKGWDEMIFTERPEIEPISGSGLPTKTTPETEMPNVLIVSEGWAASDQADFVRMTTEIVNILRNAELLRPYPRLIDSMCFWRLFVPATTRAISVLTEVYTFSKDGQQYARWLPPATSPPPSGNLDLENLVYVVGLPVPGDAGRSVSSARSRWTQTCRDYVASRVDDDVIEAWVALANRTFVDCVDTEFHMAMGQSPTAGQDDTRIFRTPTLFRGSDNLARATPVVRTTADLFGGRPLGELWMRNAPAPPPRFVNSQLVVCIAAIPGGRALAQTPVVMSAREDLGAFRIRPSGLHPGFELTGGEPALPSDMRVLATTFAHELAHKFGLGDEYGELRTPFAGAAASPNTQTDAELRDPVSNRLRGTSIRWTWHRIEAAALIEAATTALGAQFVLHVHTGHAAQFKAGDHVLLRLRGFRAAWDNSPIVSTFEVQVDHTVSDDQIVVTAPAGTTLLQMQQFAPGSIVFRPVVAPPSIRDATYPYMQLIPKAIREAVTANNAPQFTEGCNTNNFGGKQRPSLPKINPLRCFKNTWRVIGLYEGGSRHTCGIYHPAGWCLMRNNSDDATELCAVCRYVLTDLIDPSVHAAVEEMYRDIYTVE